MSGILNLETALGSLGRTSSAPVTLGPLVLTGVEVPDALAIGGQQALVIHKLVGGDRIIQSMGPDPDPITLAGMFTGPGAQARAIHLATLRDAGKPVRLGYPGGSLMVVIRPASYVYRLQGTVIPFQVTVEVLPTTVPPATASPAALSDLVRPDLASAATTISNTISTASAYAGVVAEQAQAIVGQVVPVANLVGAGGLLAGVEDRLTVVSGLATAGTNFAAAPAAAASALSGLQSAGTDLMTTINQAGANIQGIQAAAPAGSLFADATSMQALIANAGALSGAVSAGGLVNRASANTSLAAGITPASPLVTAGP
ncbi:MAG: hypothetical protein ACRYHQ_35260 [Janthinobacterium lividum]